MLGALNVNMAACRMALRVLARLGAARGAISFAISTPPFLCDECLPRRPDAVREGSA